MSTRLRYHVLWSLVPVFGTAPAADFLVTNLSQFDATVPLLRAGDGITLATGTWNNADLLLKGDGTEAGPITLRAQEAGQVFLTGSSRLRLSGSHLVVQGLVFKDGYLTSGDVILFREDVGIHANSSRLRDCEIIDYNPPDSTNDTKWVSLYGRNNRVDHCRFTGKRNEGPLLVVKLPPSDSQEATLPNYHLIDHNWFSQRPVLGENGGEIIRVGDSSTSLNVSGTRVENNFFNQCAGDVEIISNKSCENLYRYNTFVDCEGALTFRHGNRCVAAANFFFGNNHPRSGGIRISGEGHTVINNYFQDLGGYGVRAALTTMQGLENSSLDGYFQVKNAFVAFNTFVNCSNSLVLGLEAAVSVAGQIVRTTLAPSGCTIANNIVFSTNEPLVFQGITPQNLTWQGNIMFGAPLGISQPDGITFGDPILEMGTEGLWRPVIGSPALGAAQGSHPFVTEDIKGRPRLAFKDVGCDELSYSPALRSPLTAAEVGPGWRQPYQFNLKLVTQSKVTLRWPSVAGDSYQVQASSDLVHWQPASDELPADGETRTWVESPAAILPGTPRPARFYRVKQLTSTSGTGFTVTASATGQQAISVETEPQVGSYVLQFSTNLTVWQNLGNPTSVPEEIPTWEESLNALPDELLPTHYLRVRQLPGNTP